VNEKNEKIPMELSLEDGEAALQLKELLEQKAKDKINLNKNPNLNMLKRSKFYYSPNNEFREHIANYKGYAILIKQENIKEELDSKTMKMFPSLVTLTDLRKMKKVNGNIVRKSNPKTVHEFEKIALVQEVMKEIDKIKE
jgi:hypothetical protein